VGAGGGGGGQWRGHAAVVGGAGVLRTHHRAGRPFAPLMGYLHASSAVSPVWALNVQNMLWDSYTQHGLAILGGMTAMPSMHIATCTSFALVAFGVNRRLGWLFAAFAVIVQVGSVHLGWHYAIDGYVAAVGTVLILLAVG